MKESNVTAHFQMRWSNLNNKKAGCFGMCTSIEPVRFEISRKIPGNNKYAIVYQSIFFHGTQNPLNSPQHLAL